MGFLAKLFHKKSEPPLPQEIREVFDRMFGGRTCMMCGKPKASTDGKFCQPCTEFMRRNGNNSIHRCGGCGAGFFVVPNVNIPTLTERGVTRVFCACCLEHIRGMATGGDIAMLRTSQGYDDEGQVINSQFSGQSLKVKLNARYNQAMLQTMLSSKAQRNSEDLLEPIFVNAADQGTQPGTAQ